MYFALELKWSLGDNINKYFAKCLQFVLYLYNSYHMACTEGQSYVVELMVNNQFKLIQGFFISIWMLKMWMEWLI